MLQYEASTSAASILYTAVSRPPHLGPGLGPSPGSFPFGAALNRPTAATVVAQRTAATQRPSATVGLGSPGLPNVPMDRSKRKPKMEKERRDKINYFLAVLKDKLVANHVAKNSKLEKTNILEHTIKYIERLENEKKPAYCRESARQLAAEKVLQVVHTSLTGAIAHAGLADDSRTLALVSYLAERLNGALAAGFSDPPTANLIEKQPIETTVAATQPSAFTRPHKSILTRNNNNNVTTNFNNNWISQSHPNFLVPSTVAGLAPHMATWLMTAGYFSGYPGQIIHSINRLPAISAEQVEPEVSWPAAGSATSTPLEPDGDVDVDVSLDEDEDDDTTASAAGDDSGLSSGSRPEASSDTSGSTHSPEPAAVPMASGHSIGPIRGRDGVKSRARPIWCPYRDK